MAKKTKSNVESSTNRVPVLIEVRVPSGQATARSAQVPGMNIPGFQVDTSYDPVPMAATATGAMARSATSNEEVVMIRGFVDDESQIAAIEGQSNVEAVWRDEAALQPFETAVLDAPTVTAPPPMDEPVADTDQIELVASEAFGTCPIGTCDCTPGTPKATMQQVVEYLGVDQIHAGGRKGQGMVVAIMDGGIMAKGRVAGGDIDNVIGGWPSNWGQVAGWNKHGHMCATDVLGMAPEAKLYDIRISNGNFLSLALAGFQWAINQHKANGTPHVINCSFGIFQESWAPEYATNPNHPLTRKVVEAIDEGIIVLFAAGNCGGTCPDGRCTMNGGSDTGPGRSIWGANGHPKSITVGAVNINEQFVGYSSQGPAALHARKPDFVSVTHFTGYFNSDSGTSAATPVAAGVVALLKQANPALTAAQAKQILMQSAKDIGDSGWDQHTGAGIIRAKHAYDIVAKVWHTNKKVLRTYTTYHSKNAWANIETLGWRKIEPNTTDGVTNMFSALCQAQATGRTVTVYADGSNVYRMYA